MFICQPLAHYRHGTWCVLSNKTTRATTIIIVLGDLEGTKKQSAGSERIPGIRRKTGGPGWKEITEEVFPKMEAPPKQALLLRGLAEAHRECLHTDSLSSGSTSGPTPTAISQYLLGRTGPAKQAAGYLQKRSHSMGSGDMGRRPPFPKQYP